jgi:glycosyltransferase involved in cell wall biosynthesis
MRVFINAATLKVGGGKSVAINFLKELSLILAEIKTDSAVAVVPNYKDYLSLNSPFLKLIPVPSWLQNPIMRFLIMDFWIMKQLKASGANIIYSMGNIAIPEKHIPQVLLFHNPHMIYPESPIWNLMHWKDAIYNRISVYLFKKRLKYADLFLVQTETAGTRLKKYYGIKNFIITPNAISLQPKAENLIPHNFSPNPNLIYLLCLSHYYPHKNLESFIELGKKIKEQKLPFRIIITLDVKQHPAAKILLQKIENEGLNDVLLNAGALKMSDVPQWYNATQALILPTLLESFSGTYVEALCYERPVFTSNLDFATEVCGEAAYYFNPMDPNNILDVIKNAFDNPQKMAEKVAIGKTKVNEDFTWKHVAHKMFDQLALTCIKGNK